CASEGVEDARSRQASLRCVLIDVSNEGPAIGVAVHEPRPEAAPKEGTIPSSPSVESPDVEVRHTLHHARDVPVRGFDQRMEVRREEGIGDHAQAAVPDLPREERQCEPHVVFGLEDRATGNPAVEDVVRGTRTVESAMTRHRAISASYLARAGTLV